jgi:hypothetical protein
MMGWNFSTLTTTSKNNNNTTATILGWNFYPAVVVNFKKIKREEKIKRQWGKCVKPVGKHPLESLIQ